MLVKLILSILANDKSDKMKTKKHIFLDFNRKPIFIVSFFSEVEVDLFQYHAQYAYKHDVGVFDWQIEK